MAELRGEMVQLSLGRMADGMSNAADVLRALLAADSESVRLGAARSLYGAGSQIAGECRVRRAVAGAGSVFAGRPEGAT